MKQTHHNHTKGTESLYLLEKIKKKISSPFNKKLFLCVYLCELCVSVA